MSTSTTLTMPDHRWWAHVRHPFDNHDAEVEREVS